MIILSNFKKIYFYLAGTIVFIVPFLSAGTYYSAAAASQDLALGVGLIKELILPEQEETPPSQLSIIENVSKNETLTTLTKALQAADLSNVLKGNGPFTLIAPTDFAFDQLPAGTLQNLLKPENKSKLAALLTYHIIPGRKSTATLKSGKVKTLSGKDLDVKVDRNEVTINGVKVTQPEIVGLNGTIYIVDQVILQ